MSKTLPFYIGLRYVRTKRRNGFIAFVSWFALLGMALGVFAIIVVLSVMNGFDRELKERILRVVPHGFLSTDQPLIEWKGLASRIEGMPHLLASAPFIDGTGLVSYGGAVRPVEIQGVDPDYERNISLVDDFMLIGELTDIQPGSYNIILGNLVARNMGLAIGDTVSITLPQVSITPAGVFPRSKRFTLVGVFEVGAQVDQSLAIIHLTDAQRLFRYGDAVEGLHLKYDDIYRAPIEISQLKSHLGPGYAAKDWSQTQGSLFQAVKMEKTVVGIMLTIIIAVAAFNIVTSLIMMVVEKRSDIAVLRTLGLTRIGIIQIFMVQGITMGLVGIAFGALFGMGVAIYLPQMIAGLEAITGWQLFDPAVYFVSFLPSQWRAEDTIIVCAMAVIMSVGATIYPAWRASKIEPAEALRYDI